MRRGEVRLIDLAPVRGSEAGKRRPAVIVSNDRANMTAERLGPVVGRVPAPLMAQLDDALRLHLSPYPQPSRRSR